MKHCIACAEEIKRDALLCRWCGTKQDNPEYVQRASLVQSEELSNALEPVPEETSSALEWNREVLDNRQSLIEVVEGRDPSPLEDSHKLESKVPRYHRASSPSHETKARSQNIPVGSLVALVLGVALVLSGLAYIYNPNYQRSFDGWLTNIFSDTGSYFDAGYSDAKNLGADKNSSLGYANTYCSIITSAQNLPNNLARQEYLRGCVSYVTSP